MKKRYMLAAAAVVAAPFAGSMPVAEAGVPAYATINEVRMTKDPSVAKVVSHYKCQPGSEEQWLWVSAKQAEGGVKDRALEEEGSTAIAAAWIQQHPSSKLDCDGKQHQQVFTINTAFDPVNGGGFGTLVPGKVWVQFCLFDGQGNFVSEDGWFKLQNP